MQLKSEVKKNEGRKATRKSSLSLSLLFKRIAIAKRNDTRQTSEERESLALKGRLEDAEMNNSTSAALFSEIEVTSQHCRRVKVNSV